MANKVAFQSTVLSNGSGISLGGGASVEVRDSDSNALVSLWEDRAGATPLANPFSADADGSFLFYADAGRVKITITKGANTHIWYDINLLDIGADGIIYADEIAESTSGAGVTAGGALLRNGYAPFPLGHIAGLVPSNNGADATNDIDFSAGQARDAGDAYNIIASAAMTKRADATWAAGTGNGGMASGLAFGANSWHLFLLGKSTDETAYDFGFDTSLTAANLLADAAVQAAGFDVYRRVGSLLTTGAAWPVVVTRELCGGGLRVKHNVGANTSRNNPGTAAILETVSLCPTGLKLRALLNVMLYDASVATSHSLLVTDPAQADTAPSFGRQTTRVDVIATLMPVETEVVTDTSARFRARNEFSDADVANFYVHKGYIDDRRP